MSKMLILAKVIRAGWRSVKHRGKNLGDIGAEAGVLVRVRPLLVAVFGVPLAAGDGRVEGGGRVLRT